MILQRLKITGLFDQFDYDIELNQEEKITILTAPNGYGKTMILNIIHKLFTWNKWENPDFFDNIIFKKIEYFFDQNTTIEILGNSNESFFKFKEFGKVEFEELSSERMLFLSSLNDSTQTFYSYLIEEQRLIKKYYYHSSEDESGYEVELRDTINENSKDLKSNIVLAQEKSLQVSQELDSSFPTRLLSKKNALSKQDFNARFLELQNKQKKLKKHGLYSNNQEVPNRYDKENAKVLSIYLEDSEQKLSAFDDLLNRLELFTDVLNNRRLLFKQIKINPKTGFEFYTDKGEKLALSDLSSGEQHQVVLLYELIFKVEPETLVLIDEPEISLHVVWQEQFINDLMEIVNLNNIQVLLATHSPEIINGYGDLHIDLYEQLQEQPEYEAQV